MRISRVYGLEVLDSRGNPTVKATVVLKNGSRASAMVPSGASTGTHEKLELRDNDANRYHGLGVQEAVEHINTTIEEALIGKDAGEQRDIDRTMIELDGTENKSNLGANAILAVSLAVARAEAQSRGVELFEYLTHLNPDFAYEYIMPIPQMNVLNGGKHADWATDIQEFMILPVGSHSITDAIRMGTEIYQQLKTVLKSRNYSIHVGDEGGFAPNVQSNTEPFELLKEAIEGLHYEFGTDVMLGIDAAASEFYSDNKYVLKKEHTTMTSAELSDFYYSLINKYPIKSMEDIFAEDDWQSFISCTKTIGDTVQIVGDDLFVTDVKRLEYGIEVNAANSILIKVNQIGSLSETIDAILLARKHGLTSIISHRSGETEDPFIADLAVAMGTGQIKSGAPCRSDRTAKYNRLLEIEQYCKYHNIPSSYAIFPF